MRSYTANATFDGAGTIIATWLDYEAPACEEEENETSLPHYTVNVSGVDENRTHTACLTADADTYLFEGKINATGRMTADLSLIHI